MSVIVIIQDREALPIRVLPFVTGWFISPDIVAKSFSGTDHWITRLQGIVAFHLLSDGLYAEMLPKEWDGIETDLQILSEKLRLTESFEQENYPVWRRESIPLLPAGCFVWKDEFEEAFKNSYAPKKLILMAERPGDRELNFSPRIPNVLIDVVMEGFLNKQPQTTTFVDVQKPKKVGRRQLQHEAILAAIDALGYDNMAIPDRGKSKIREALLSQPQLFTKSGFNHAWHSGVKAGLFRHVNHSKYSII